MNPRTIGYDELLSRLWTVVGEQGDRVYALPAELRAYGTPGRYFHGDQPGCLHGHVLAGLGVTAAALVEATAPTGPVWQVYRDLGWHLTDKATALAQFSQHAQDRAMTSAEAIAEGVRLAADVDAVPVDMPGWVAGERRRRLAAILKGQSDGG